MLFIEAQMWEREEKNYNKNIRIIKKNGRTVENLLALHLQFSSCRRGKKGQRVAVDYLSNSGLQRLMAYPFLELPYPLASRL